MSARRARRGPWVLLLVVLLLGGGIWWWLAGRADTGASGPPVAEVERGRLRVTVLESGSVEALKSQTITSRVEGNAAILFIVPEGTILTDQDVAEHRLLVQLDAANTVDQLNRQKIDLAQATAARKNAEASLDITQQQNASEIRKAQLEVRFARLDLERYVGKDLSGDLLSAAALPVDLPPDDAPEAGVSVPPTAPAQAPTARHEPTAPAPAGAGDGGPVSAGGSDGDDASPPAAAPTVPPTAAAMAAAEQPDPLEGRIARLLDDPRLEGEALQTIRKLDSDISIADEEFRRAQVKLDWTGRLLEKGYVSREDEEADRIALERWRIDLDRARTARDQYVTYDFRKETERLLSNLVEAEAQLARTLKSARSSEERELAEVRSRTEQEQLQSERFQRLQRQVAAATIRATEPGLVVYASSQRHSRWGNDNPIREGVLVQERQPLIEIPDLASLGVKVSIHESVVERVQEGQPATVLVDAFPDRPIPGVVKTVARLPDPPDSWLNPDLKVYSTEIQLDAVPPTLRPGMSAKVEILVADIEDAVSVPVQAVAGTADRPVVYVSEGPGEPTPRPVRLGLSNDLVVQILDGVEPGEHVLLAPPHAGRMSSGTHGRAPSGARTRRGAPGAPAAGGAAETAPPADAHGGAAHPGGPSGGAAPASDASAAPAAPDAGAKPDAATPAGSTGHAGGRSRGGRR